MSFKVLHEEFLSFVGSLKSLSDAFMGNYLLLNQQLDQPLTLTAAGRTGMLWVREGVTNDLVYTDSNNNTYTVGGAGGVSTGSIRLTDTSNQIKLGPLPNDITLSGPTPAAARVYTIPDVGGDDTFTLNGAAQTLTNKTISGTTNTVEATALRSATTAVVVNGATAPTTGQVLTATSSTAASWQTPASGVSQVNTGTGLTGGPITTTGTISLVTPVTVANGGTGATTLTGNGITTVNAGGTALVSNTLTNGQLLIGRTGNTPLAATLTGTTNQVTVTPASGSITLSLPQNINTAATPTFASETLSATTNQLVLGTGTTTTLTAPAPAASRVYTIPDAGGSDTFTLNAATQTLTNKTITANTNNVTASSLFSGSRGNTISIFAATNPTAGQVLTATSATSADWETPAAGIKTVAVSTFSTSSTYFPGTNMVYAIVEIVGGGGAGGGSAITDGSSTSVGAGGGAGGYAYAILSAGIIGASQFITIGDGGIAAAGAAGGNGGSTDFGGIFSATGGTGGGTSGTIAVAGVATPGAGGSGSGSANIIISGQSGAAAFGLTANSLVYSGAGGSSIFGFGGPSVAGASSGSASAGVAGTGAGAGGSGAISGTNVAATQAGGAGARGFCRIVEFRT